MPSRPRGWVGLLLILSVLIASAAPDVGIGQGRRNRDGRRPQQYRYADAFRERDRSVEPDEPAKVQPITAPLISSAAELPKAPIAPSACYKDGADLDLQKVRLDFVDSGFQWPQPDGSGTPITITYSYSNLLNGQMQGLTAAQLKQGIEEALTLWSKYAPLNFVEVADSGPTPTSSDSNYAAAGRPQIRFGQHTIDGASGATLAHTYLPYSSDEGIAGDVHFDRDEDWSAAGGGYFLETTLHELGHTLGLDHEVTLEAIMNPIIADRFSALGKGYLLADDIAGIRAIYGTGVGSVTPLPVEEPEEPEEPPTEEPENATGNVTATLDATTGELVIAGDAMDNHLVIASSWWGTFVRGLDETTVNGGEGEFFDGRPTTITCELGGGNDLLKAIHLRGTTFVGNLGEGNDELTLYSGRFEQFTVDAGIGNDVVKTRSLRSTLATFTLGEGDDELNIWWSRITELLADGGLGTDTITRARARIEIVTQLDGFETDEIVRWWGRRWFWWWW